MHGLVRAGTSVALGESLLELEAMLEFRQESYLMINGK